MKDNKSLNRVLVLDTSSAVATVGLCEGLETKIELALCSGISHSEQLLVQIRHCMNTVGWSFDDLDAIVIGTGPGLFTGLRVGVATAQGLAFASQCPLIGVDSLEARALTAPANASLIAVCMDARKKELYYALFRRTMGALDTCSPVLEPHLERVGVTSLLSPERICDVLKPLNEPVLFLGNGFDLYKDFFVEALQGHCQVPTSEHFAKLQVSALASLALRDYDMSKNYESWLVEPQYIRPSEAEWKIGPPEGGGPLKDRFLPDGSLLPIKSDLKDGGSV